MSEKMSETPKPTVGRIVHFVLDNGAHRPAVITSTNGGTVNLQIFPDAMNDHLVAPVDRPYWENAVIQDETSKAQHTWHWPERE